MKQKILLVEDDLDICLVLEENILKAGYDFERAADGKTGVEIALKDTCDLVILDLMLPELDGLEVCRQIRERNSKLPILMLTARTDVVDRVQGLETGADDYLTKPFETAELMARVKALLRRSAKSTNKKRAILKFDALVVDPQKRLVSNAQQEVKLTLKEFELLYFLASNPEKAFSRSELLENVWGYTNEGYENTVNAHINRLRNKLETHPSEPQYICTVWGIGYCFKNSA